MPIEIKELAGGMNLDDPIENIGKGFHMNARNLYFQGVPGNMRAENIEGFENVDNPFLPFNANNLTIGRHYDPNKKRIFYFNYQSGGDNGIYVYNTLTQTFQRLVVENFNAEAGTLNFQPNVPIHNIDILYGDSNLGDILFFIDSEGVPKKVNIDRALAGGYGTIISDYMSVIKQPADIPPSVIYENDPSNTVNALRKKLFKFKQRNVYDDQDKSVTSSQSKVPLPYDAFNQSHDSDPTKNCRIAITYQTGPANVKKIELLACVSDGNQFSDYFLIASIDKAVEGLADNDIATYLFYNDKGYVNIDLNESIQIQDYVPKRAGAQTILNGNVPAYGDVTEGFDLLTDFSFNGNTSNIAISQTPFYYNNTWTNLVANQSGNSGFGTGNIHINIRGIVVTSGSLDTYVVYMTDGSDISYTLSNGDDAAAIIEGLRLDAISKGYTIVSNTANDLVVSRAATSLARIYIDSGYVYNLGLNTSFYSYDWASKHGYGLVYFDGFGRTNGVVYTTGFSVSTNAYSQLGGPADKPQLNATIYHVPPIWANYFQWVRTKDLTKQKIQQWITDRTFKDIFNISGLVKYAYLSIESLNAFKQNNPGSPLEYGFTSGDRVRFHKRFDGDGGTATLYGNTKDFEITASVVNPIINGELKTGQFVKLLLPSTDGSFDFGVGYANYFIELYTPAKSGANGLDVYFEFGERYAIGNPGQSTRFHQGYLQNQSEDHLTPALYRFIDGEYYIRKRSVQVGNVYTFNVVNGGVGGTHTRILIGLNFQNSTYNDPNITAQSVPYAPLTITFNPGFDSRWFLRAIAVTDFKISGTITLTFNESSAGDVWRIYTVNRYGEQKNLVPPFDASTPTIHTFEIDDTITLEDDRIFLIAQSMLVRPREVTFSTSNLTFTIDHVIDQQMVDQNFSDYFASAVNSNGRAFVYDPDAKEVNYPTMYRWGLDFQLDTSINNTNRFYPENFDNVDRRFGAIKKMAIWEKRLTIFQERKCGWAAVYNRIISDTSGNNQLTTSNEIISKNNIQYYAGDFGCSNQPTSIIQSGFRFYFIDPVYGKIIRLSNDGLTDLSLLYKVQTWAGNNLPNYLQPGNYTYGGLQKVLGAYVVRKENTDIILFVAQGTEDDRGEAIYFDETRNSFPSLIDIDCDQIVCAENVLYMWVNGQMLKQSTASYNVFGGVSFPSIIELPFNDSEPIKKNYLALGYQSQQTWFAQNKGDVKTNSLNSQTLLQQESKIMEQDFDTRENPSRYAAFNRDMNSMTNQNLALWEGDYLIGNTVIVKLSLFGASYSYLYAPYITYRVQPRNF